MKRSDFLLNLILIDEWIACLRKTIFSLFPSLILKTLSLSLQRPFNPFPYKDFNLVF